MSNSPVTLSEAGIALIIMEGQLENINKEMRRWRRRKEEAEMSLAECTAQWNSTISAINRLKEQINRKPVTVPYFQD